MEVIGLSKVDTGVFRKDRHMQIHKDARKWVHCPDRFKLAIRCCDGTFRVVNSEIAAIMQGGITKKEIKLAVNALAPMDPIHGQRYVIFEENPTGIAYLLGPVEEAIVMLANA